ncbi:DNA cytosine methyltransferase [Frankia sp. CiP1_Cm_nod2]|uniref:DNA cytosine methyltransferase n=1 Tax=Frankia sp. CiP1_Cm_nod2 TaxID=2897161 RepID=UPI0020248699
MDTPIVLDLFAGAGGWSIALSSLGFTAVGVEWDAAACRTRRAAGLDTIETDVSLLSPHDFTDAVGLVASPPCQPFSTAGAKRGFADPRAHLLFEPLRFVHALRPAWVAFEEVPAVLPVWESMAAQLRGLGYATWHGVLSSEEYGVAQTRRRAFLLASRAHRTIGPPPASHSRYGPGRQRLTPPLAPWHSMADALGRGLVDRPAYTVTTRGNWWGGIGARVALRRAQQEGRWVGAPDRLSVAEFGRLQGFPDDHPWQGSVEARLRQIGNAVPPPLAAAALSAVALPARIGTPAATSLRPTG